MALSKDWRDLPAVLAPTAGETLFDWHARIAAYDAANPGVLTKLNAVALEDIEARVQAELNAKAGTAARAFSVYRATAVSLANDAVLVCDIEEFDTAGWHDPVAGRFTPQLAGYYRFSWAISANVAMTADAYWQASLRKNGVINKRAAVVFQRGTTAPSSAGSALVYANGTTNYFEVVLTHNNASSVAVWPSSTGSYFQGELVGT